MHSLTPTGFKLRDGGMEAGRIGGGEGDARYMGVWWGYPGVYDKFWGISGNFLRNLWEYPEIQADIVKKFRFFWGMVYEKLIGS